MLNFKPEQLRPKIPNPFNLPNPYKLPQEILDFLHALGWNYFEFQKHSAEGGKVLRYQLERKDGRVFAFAEHGWNDFLYKHKEFEPIRNVWIVGYINNALEVHK